jgi:hypothetical protein
MLKNLSNQAMNKSEYRTRIIVYTVQVCVCACVHECVLMKVYILDSEINPQIQRPSLESLPHSPRTSTTVTQHPYARSAATTVATTCQCSARSGCPVDVHHWHVQCGQTTSTSCADSYRTLASPAGSLRPGRVSLLWA